MKKTILRSTLILTAVMLGIIVLTSCAQRTVVTPCLMGHTYGFWGGLLHGFIAPFDLIGMLLWDNITVYAENNNGAWYAFGFLLGSGGWGLLGGRGVKRRRSRE
jgi:hypothetical protein